MNHAEYRSRADAYTHRLLWHIATMKNCDVIVVMAPTDNERLEVLIRALRVCLSERRVLCVRVHACCVCLCVPFMERDMGAR